ncbi:DinB family protein [Branchiibius cervicis]|uniref:DinB family protein n=1 Tax=Branchiibius cervicis TaxID=908252 RepID=A0ABW2ARK1_9MICO
MTDPRTAPPLQGTEINTLLGFLQYHRDTLLMKVDGLEQVQLNTRFAPSEMTLGGLMKHVAFVEDYWFQDILLGAQMPEPWASADWEADRDWDWHSATSDSPMQLRMFVLRARERSDRAIAACMRAERLDTLSQRADRRTGQPFTLRWIMLHLIEEYARHNGHADLIRESIDGSTGD